MYSIVDLHMHVVPGIDDGAPNMGEALKMLKLAEQQGIVDLFCTSHNGYSKEDGENYLYAFNKLKDRVSQLGINIRLHKGCEILCAAEYIDEILYGLEIGAFSTLGNSKYVLTELYPDTRPSEALLIVDKLKNNGYQPIIAHMERNNNITGLMVATLIQSGAMIQVNAHSFVDEKDVEIKERARELLKNQYIHFIGSDAHRITHRPPNVLFGVKYILENTDNNYAMSILNGNAARLISENKQYEDYIMRSKEDVVNELYNSIKEYGLIMSIHKIWGNRAKMNLGFTKNVCDVPIEEISFSVRGYNVLKRSNINTLGEVIDVLNDKKIMSLKNLGERTAREIKTKIINYGFNALSEQDKKAFLSEVVELNSKNT